MEVLTAAVVGTGLIGTSVALALVRRGVVVHLLDRDPGAARVAAERGAGLFGPPAEPVDLAVLAVPPGQVARVLAEQQRHGLARSYTDVASVKEQPLAAAAAEGCDLSLYAGGHPMAGSEESGPLAARAELFVGKPWVLTPSRFSSPAAVARVRRLAELCGAVPVTMGTREHDRAVALVSHAPHLVASLMAARLEHAPEAAVSVAGQGVRDVTRIAAGDAGLWGDILGANAAEVAEVLAELARDLELTVAALLQLAGGEPQQRVDGGAGLRGVLVRGRAGRARVAPVQVAPVQAAPVRAVAAKAAAQRPAGTVSVLVGEHPQAVARLFAEVDSLTQGRVALVPRRPPGRTAGGIGLVDLTVAPESVDELVDELCGRGWPALC